MPPPFPGGVFRLIQPGKHATGRSILNEKGHPTTEFIQGGKPGCDTMESPHDLVALHGAERFERVVDLPPPMMAVPVVSGIDETVYQDATDKFPLAEEAGVRVLGSKKQGYYVVKDGVLGSLNRDTMDFKSTKEFLKELIAKAKEAAAQAEVGDEDEEAPKPKKVKKSKKKG